MAQTQIFQSVAGGLQFGSLALLFRSLLFVFGCMFRFALQQQSAHCGGTGRQRCGIERCGHVRIFQHRFASDQVLSCCY